MFLFFITIMPLIIFGIYILYLFQKKVYSLSEVIGHFAYEFAIAFNTSIKENLLSKMFWRKFLTSCLFIIIAGIGYWIIVVLNVKIITYLFNNNYNGIISIVIPVFLSIPIIKSANHLYIYMKNNPTSF